MPARSVLVLVLAAAAALAAGLIYPAGTAAAGETRKPALVVLNYLTGWSHDAMGYHPSIYLLLQNASGRDLSQKSVKFQGRFTDTNTEEVLIGRAEMRPPRPRFFVAIVAARAYELPLTVEHWPHIECKVMTRIGNASLDEVEDLLITRVDQVTRTYEDSFATLNELSGYSPQAAGSFTPDTAWRACPGNPWTPAGSEIKGCPAEDPRGVLTALRRQALPALGDDFFDFEKRFGLPAEVDAGLSDWTWAKYKDQSSGCEFMIGSRERTGKADIIVARLTRDATTSDAALLALGRALSGKLAGQVGQATRSVRYLPGGRLEMLQLRAPGSKIDCLFPPAAGQTAGVCFLAVSRLNPDTRETLAMLCRKTTVLKPLAFLSPAPPAESAPDH